LIVGVGGLGVPALCALAPAGVQISLIDPDPVELSNLARQVIYREGDIGAPKADAAARWLRARYQGIEVESMVLALDASNAVELASRHDVVIDATDNPATKFLLNDTALETRTPLVYGGVLGMAGQAMTIVPGESACLRCLFEEVPNEDEIASCRAAGIVGPVAGVIGEVQAGEAAAVLQHKQPSLASRMLTFDAAQGSRFRITEISPRKGCACGALRKTEQAKSPAR